jgi:hypothetical protein
VIEAFRTGNGCPFGEVMIILEKNDGEKSRLLVTDAHLFPKYATSSSFAKAIADHIGKVLQG